MLKYQQIAAEIETYIEEHQLQQGRQTASPRNPHGPV